MSRFFVEAGMISGSLISLSEEDAQHLARVLRATVGEEITVCDDAGNEHRAEIFEITKKNVTAKIKETKLCDTEPCVKVTLFQGLPKGSKMELIIQKSVEIGVHSIVPVATSRAVVKLSEEKGKGKEERWNKISQEAAKQSSRGIVPVVEGPVSFEEAVKRASEYDMAIIPYEKQGEGCLKEYLSTQKPESIAVFIGPEGGFEESEIELAEKFGVKPVSLGKRILRTETAPITALSVIMYEYDWR